MELIEDLGLSGRARLMRIRILIELLESGKSLSLNKRINLFLVWK